MSHISNDKGFQVTLSHEMHLIKSPHINMHVSNVYLLHHKLLYNVFSWLIKYSSIPFLLHCRLVSFFLFFLLCSVINMSSALSSTVLMSVWNTTKVPLHVGYNSPSAPSAHVQLKLHYFFFFCSESVRKKKTVGNCAFKTTRGRNGCRKTFECYMV